MILVGDQVFSIAGETQESSELESWQLLNTLLVHSDLCALLETLRSTPLLTINGSATGKFVYVFQKEYATADPAHVEFIGTDEMTTCIGVAIRSPKTGLTSVGHLDSPDDAELGLKQMVSSIDQNKHQDILEVCLVGAYDDIRDLSARPNAAVRVNSVDSSKSENGPDMPIENGGYSWPLALKIFEALYRSPQVFQLKTVCILQQNTCIGLNGYSCPIFRGFVVETRTGHIMPARFDMESRCPDGIVRQLRVTVATSDPDWKGGLLETYDTSIDRFIIAPVKWSLSWSYYAMKVLDLSNSELLTQQSTSPYAESEDFVMTIRGAYSYLCKFPDWKQTFPGTEPRVFTRNASGGWTRLLLSSRPVELYNI